MNYVTPGSRPCVDENKKPKTLAAVVPPNSYPGMQFFIEYQPASAHGSE